MIHSLKYNASLLRRSRAFSKLRKEFYSVRTELKFIDKERSKSELKLLKDNIRKRARNERVRSYLVLIILGCLLLGSSVLLVDKVFDIQKFWSLNERLYQVEQKSINEKSRYFIDDGESWLDAREYHNAIFQFQKAIEIKPKEYEGHHLLLIARMRKCSELLEDCDGANYQLTKVLSDFPSKRDLTLNNLMETLITIGDSARAIETEKRCVQLRQSKE